MECFLRGNAKRMQGKPSAIIQEEFVMVQQQHFNKCLELNELKQKFKKQQQQIDGVVQQLLQSTATFKYYYQKLMKLFNDLNEQNEKIMKNFNMIDENLESFHWILNQPISELISMHEEANEYKQNEEGLR